MYAFIYIRDQNICFVCILHCIQNSTRNSFPEARKGVLKELNDDFVKLVRIKHMFLDDNNKNIIIRLQA